MWAVANEMVGCGGRSVALACGRTESAEHPVTSRQVNAVPIWVRPGRRGFRCRRNLTQRRQTYPVAPGTRRAPGSPAYGRLFGSALRAHFHQAGVGQASPKPGAA